ncbi:hypothetical protein GCM10010271_71260 [Streptomyces kurssanovii]|nr:hypothetical protein GCM10010271_71260 [Streptomyces kurssanovii]
MSGWSGLTKAYTSVLSNWGCPDIKGASRWLDAVALCGWSIAAPAADSPAAASAPQVTRATLLRVGRGHRPQLIGIIAFVLRPTSGPTRLYVQYVRDRRLARS